MGRVAVAHRNRTFKRALKALLRAPSDAFSNPTVVPRHYVPLVSWSIENGDGAAGTAENGGEDGHCATLAHETLGCFDGEPSLCIVLCVIAPEAA